MLPAVSMTKEPCAAWQEQLQGSGWLCRHSRSLPAIEAHLLPLSTLLRQSVLLRFPFRRRKRHLKLLTLPAVLRPAPSPSELEQLRAHTLQGTRHRSRARGGGGDRQVAVSKCVELCGSMTNSRHHLSNTRTHHTHPPTLTCHWRSLSCWRRRMSHPHRASS